MDSEGDTTKPGCVTLDPGGKYIINWRPKGGQVSESSRAPGESNFKVQPESKWIINYTNLRVFLQKVDAHTNTGRVSAHRGNQDVG